MNKNKDIEINKKKYRDNMTDEQKQKRREANKRIEIILAMNRNKN